MKTFYLSVRFFSFLVTVFAAAPSKSACLEREKAVALLETAEDFLSKAEDSFPSCRDFPNSTNESECSSQKPLAYIEISKKLISDVKQNFPNCTGPKVTVEDVKHSDCSAIFASGHNESGVYTFWPSESNTNGKPLQVYCDMKTEGGGWTLIQRRGKFTVQQNFIQDWETYKNGFGDITEEFWLGNENIRVLCHKGCKIRFDLKDKAGWKRFAEYQSFTLNESDYKISISDYKGNAGDALKYQNNHAFSTNGKGYTEKVEKYQGGWWYSDENYCNLNGPYRPEISYYPTVHWYPWRKLDNLARVEIKVLAK